MKQEDPFRPYIRQCQNPQCNMRYPVTEVTGKEHICPVCQGSTAFVAHYPQHPTQSSEQPSRPPFSLLLDNIRSIFNVGSIFRSADGCGLVEHIYLCGITPTPDHPKMAKTSLGAETNIPWTYHTNALVIAEKLISEGCQLIALETTQQSELISPRVISHFSGQSIVMVGNEVAGLDPALLALAHRHIHLPMHGIKESLNVAIAASIFLYLNTI